MSNQPWDKLYTTRKWRTFRWRILVRDDFTCQMCGRVEAPSKLVADHKQPHKGDMALFWDETNCQALCKPCHDGPKQSREKGGDRPVRQAIGLDGWPQG